MKSQRQVAAELGISAAAVADTEKRAKRKIREAIMRDSELVDAVIEMFGCSAFRVDKPKRSQVDLPGVKEKDG